MTKTETKYMAKLKADPRIGNVWFEGADGWWCDVKDGYNSEGCSSMHGETVKELYERLYTVEVGPTY